MNKDIILPHIQATSSVRFLEIEKIIRTLPQPVFDQIELVKDSLVGIQCVFRKTYDDKPYVIPKNATQIKNFGDYIGVYTDQFFFTIPITDKTNNLSYLLI